MTKHPSNTDLNRYSKRTLSPADLLVISDHLAVCEECYQYINSEDRLASTVAFLQLDLNAAEYEDLEHPSYDHIAALAGDELDRFEREYAQIHLAVCPECETLYKDILRFRADVDFDRVYAPPVEPTYRERLRGFWKVPIYRIPIVITGSLAVLAIVVWAATLPLRNKLNNLQTQIGQLRQENAFLQGSVSNMAMLEAEVARLSRENTQLQQLFPPSPGMTGNLTADNSPRILFTLNDGDSKVALDGRGHLTGLNLIPPKYQAAVKNALQLQRAELASLNYLAGKPKKLLSPDNNPALSILLSPVGSVVSTAQPTLRWKPLEGATGYNVTIYSDNMKKTISSEMLTLTEWTSPPLARGRVYSWQVRAVKDGKEIVFPAPNAPDALFKIVDTSQTQELERAKRLYSKSHLTLGVLYARLGLLEDAAVEFQALLNDNPNSPIVKKLLESVTTKHPKSNSR